jgi:hypothetical protein
VCHSCIIYSCGIVFLNLTIRLVIYLEESTLLPPALFLFFIKASLLFPFACICYTHAHMPRHPEQGRRPEQQLPAYHLAARFREDTVSKQVYDQAQHIIHTTDNELSAYRFLRPSQIAKEPPWYVVVLGDTPPEAVHQQFEEVLKPGERVSLPAEALVPLYQRRLQEIKKGSWVEHHTDLHAQRRNPNKDKGKRKMQDKSRRRNRGR